MAEMETGPVVEVTLTAGPTLEVEITGTGPVGPVGPRGPKGDTGEDGLDGVGIAEVTMVAGDHIPGEKDMYAIRFDDGRETTFQVYNGADGKGAGDMRADVYDPRGKYTDVFQYVDDAVDGIDLSGYYTKEETDGALEGYYTRAETDGALVDLRDTVARQMSEKADADDVVSSFNGRRGPVMPQAGDYSYEGLTDKPTAEQIYASIRSMIMLDAHPVGSYYWSDDSTDPGTLFGGTWTQIKDRFILAAGDDYEAGSEGGSATVTLTTQQIPSHTHSSKSLTGNAYFRGYDKGTHNTVTSASGIMSLTQETWSGAHDGLAGSSITNQAQPKLTINATHEHTSVGGNQSHNNMPPYIVAYCWRRTA